MALGAKATSRCILKSHLSNIIRLMFSRRWWWTTLLVLGGILLTIRLGIWQIDRDYQARSQTNHIKTMQALPVLEISTLAAQGNLEDMEYRAVRVTGTYDYEHQIAIRNQVWAQDWGIEPGFALLTPLVLENGQAILVEVGFLPNITHRLPGGNSMSRVLLRSKESFG